MTDSKHQQDNNNPNNKQQQQHKKKIKPERKEKKRGKPCWNISNIDGNTAGILEAKKRFNFLRSRQTETKQINRQFISEEK